MELQESQFRKVIADFCNEHFEGKSRSVIAGNGAVSPTTVTNFLNGKTNTGIYTSYRILKGMDQSFVSLGYAIEREEARLENHSAYAADTVRESGFSASVRYHSSEEQERARQDALDILAKAGSRKGAQAVLDARQDRIEREVLVNQFLKEFLDDTKKTEER